MTDRVVVVTNDFGPRAGGIETFVTELLARLDPERLVVHCGAQPGALEHDRQLPYPVVRDPATTLLPTRGLATRVAATARSYDATCAWFPSAAPLALLAPALRDAGVRRVVASTHGHELWWSRLPASRQLLRRAAAGVDTLTVVSATVRRPIAAALPERARAGLVQLSPGVDAARFQPGASAPQLAARFGPPQSRGPLVLCASRLVRRKGHARLAASWPAVRRQHPTALLALAGSGPDEPAVRRAAAAVGGERAGVHLVGRLSDAELPGWYAAADLFVLPVADRLGGLVTEALGIVLLEAAAAGTAVVSGRAGGTVEAVLDGRTGLLIDARDRAALTATVSGLLADSERRRRLAAAGRRWATAAWSWQTSAQRLERLLAGERVARWP